MRTEKKQPYLTPNHRQFNHMASLINEAPANFGEFRLRAKGDWQYSTIDVKAGVPLARDPKVATVNVHYRQPEGANYTVPSDVFVTLYPNAAQWAGLDIGGVKTTVKQAAAEAGYPTPRFVLSE